MIIKIILAVFALADLLKHVYIGGIILAVLYGVLAYMIWEMIPEECKMCKREPEPKDPIDCKDPIACVAEYFVFFIVIAAVVVFFVGSFK